MQDRIDDAIDRAVRDIMDVEPDGSFRARVLGRLESRPRRSAPLRTALALAAAALAVALAAVGVTIVRREPAPTPAAQAVVTSPAPAVPGAAPRPSFVSEAGRSTPPLAVPARRSQPASGRPLAAPEDRVLRAASIDEPESSVAPLDTVPPIALEPVSARAIGPDRIVIAPLAPLDAVQVAPLSSETDRY